MKQLTPAQIRAVKWYIGDVAGDDPFWGDPKVYVTVNSLFFPGIETERARAGEGKRLNPDVLSDESRLIGVLRDLLSAFTPLESPMEVYRVERFADFRQMQDAGRTISFTSTSTAGFLKAYQDRAGIALMRFHLAAGVLCIPMAQILDTYAKADEAEILLPPYMRLQFEKLPLLEEEKSILDANGEPPMISVRAVPCGMVLPRIENDMIADRTAGSRVYAALQAGKEPDPDDINAYSAWKTVLVSRALTPNTNLKKNYTW